MDELEKAQAISLSGPQRSDALRRFREQIALWDVAMPKTEPVVFDFGLRQFESVGLIECWIANEIDAGYCGKYLFVADGQTCPTHHHQGKHETFFVVAGRVRVSYDGKDMELDKGDVLAVSPMTKHNFTGLGPALLLELSQPCIIDDNYFEDTSIPIGGNYKAPKREG